MVYSLLWVMQDLYHQQYVPNPHCKYKATTTTQHQSRIEHLQEPWKALVLTISLITPRNPKVVNPKP